MNVENPRTPPPEAVAAAKDKISGLRDRLIDLTTRNRFLNFPHRANARAEALADQERSGQLSGTAGEGAVFRVLTQKTEELRSLLKTYALL